VLPWGRRNVKGKKESGEGGKEQLTWPSLSNPNSWSLAEH